MDDQDTTTEREAMVKVTFHPQAWQSDYAVSVDPEGSTTFWVPIKDALGDDEKVVQDNTYESDLLRLHENAPEWVQEWTGPHYVTIDEVPEEYA